MTNDVTLNRATRWIAHPLTAYAIAAVAMVIGWTAIHYVDQPDKSPTYRRSILDCFVSAAWTTPIEGAGPFVPLTLRMVFMLPEPEMSMWALPLMGAPIYIVLALLLSRFGRRWSPYAHASIGAAWLLVGAIVLTRLTMK